MSSQGIRAGKAFVEITGDDTKLQAAMKRVQYGMEQTANVADRVGSALMKAGAAGVTAFGGMIAVFAKAGDEVNKASDRTGVAVEELYKLKYAAEQSGSSLSDVEAGLRGMARLMDGARRGTETAVETLAMLGMTYEDLAGLSPEEQLLRLGDALSQITDETQQTALAMQVFGKSGVNLLPMLAAGRSGVEQLMQRAVELGLVLDKETTQAATDFGDALDDLKQVSIAAAMAVGGALAGDVQKFVEGAREGVQELVEWIKQNREMVVLAAKVAVGVAGAGVALKALAGTRRNGSTVTSFFLAHPIVATLTAIAGAAIAAGQAMSKYAAAATEAAAASAKVFAAGQSTRKTDEQVYAARLSQLGSRGTLGATDQEEAAKIIDHLERRYGDLGITVDETTGKINGLTDGLDKMAEAMRAEAAGQLEKRIADLKKSIEEIRGWENSPVVNEGQAREFRGRRMVQEVNLQIAEKQLEKVLAGDRDTILGISLAERAQAGLAAGDTPSEQAAELPDDAPVEASDVKVSAHQRAYEETERREAEQREAERKQAKEEADRERQRIAEANRDLRRQAEIAQAMAAGDEEKAQRLRDRFEREDAAAAGLDVRTLRQRQRADAVVRDMANSDPITRSSAGGFSGSLIARQFGQSVQEQQLREIKALRNQQREEARRLAKAVKDSAGQVV